MITTDNPRRGRLMRIVATAAAAIAVLVALPGAASAADIQTTVSLDPQPGGFYGYVDSPDPGCELNRTVELYRIKKNKQLKLVSSTVAASIGERSYWSLAGAKSGKYVAQVPQLVTGPGEFPVVCGAAISAKVHSLN
jgi:hypothetical protein